MSMFEPLSKMRVTSPPVGMNSNTEGRIIHYSYNETLYFGKGQNIPTGGDVTLIFDNGSNIDIRWGLAKELSVIHKLRMNYDIPPDSSVKVHIMATQIDRKLEYSATLVLRQLAQTLTTILFTLATNLIS